ncbi:AMP-dependent synthetase and ligase [Capnocytophaga ochracea DSM 7271]|uniref:AMP-dependent synthetase and ligase n=1 Tax=Capnocytophaga ochracea (strain ATCC 27872 / DSM 7271 / CCUG 9716 / JCM 12966 / NCTC 12371 / SS31 / VPI 2845) TaxID=521097 RepID=C7M9H4_CAPOD|nr:AMP-binding protein [Capnocytophaga ochracea]ACU93558.1 AMP-dependent synthetase and ligase [Capnocytophaga ochracea DSM 7271]UAK52244.1 AMP-binding protein [Capnocytophaga ochracea]
MNKNLAYTYGASNISLIGETIDQNLRKTVEKYPNKEALISVHQDYRVTYAEFYAQVTAVAKGLIALGVKQGDRVGIWSPNCYEWTLLQYATAKIGAIMVNINPAYRTSELIYVINQSGISYIFAAPQFKSSNYKKMIDDAREFTETLRKEVYWGESWQHFLAHGEKVTDEKLLSFEERVQFDDPVNIQYTSGTTGNPKGVTLSHHNILNNGYFIGIRMNYTEKDRVCIPVPFYHCFGMVIGNIACTTHGATMVIPNDSFDATKTLEAVEKEKCTSLYGVPTMFISELYVLDKQPYDLSSLRTGVMAGALCPPEIMKRVKEQMNMHEITICYGMTETSPVSTQTKIGAPFEKQIYSVGTIHDHLEIKIINPETKAIVKRGENGELCTRGYSVMLKYWNSPQATQQVIDEQRWMHSGDLAMMDEDGYIHISGRIKDLIIRGGENISPKEIEDFLYTYKGVMDAQVIGVPSKKYGEEVMAWIKPKEGVTLTEEELHDFCKGRIAHYKVPRYWKFVEEFPMTISGKIRKVEMREISARELGLEDED